MSVYAAGTPALPMAEAESLTLTLLGDVSSRLCAASNGWILPLPTWATVRNLSALAALAGVEASFPWSESAASVATPEEIEAAEARLRERWG